MGIRQRSRNRQQSHNMPILTTTTISNTMSENQETWRKAHFWYILQWRRGLSVVQGPKILPLCLCYVKRICLSTLLYRRCCIHPKRAWRCCEIEPAGRDFSITGEGRTPYSPNWTSRGLVNSNLYGIGIPKVLGVCDSTRCEGPHLITRDNLHTKQ